MNIFTPSYVRSSRRAFTLIELLTVIAIIGILAAIIIPTVGKVRESARATQCSSNMRQVGMALNLYAQDNKGKLPPGQSDGVKEPSVPLNQEWTTTLKPVLPNPQNGRNAVMTCPAHNYADNPSFNPDPLRPAFTYAMGPGAGGINSFKNDNDAAFSRTMNSIPNLSRAVFVMEAKTAPNAFNTPGRKVMQKGDLYAITTLVGGLTGNENIQFWHGGKNRTNLVFGDGSVRAFSPSELAARFPGTQQQVWVAAAGL